MSLENTNFNFGVDSKKGTMSDKEYLIRNTPKPYNWTHKLVQKIIISKIDEEEVRNKVLKKLQKCPDAALESFVMDLDNIIAQTFAASKPQTQKNKLKKKTDTITIDDIIAMRNTISQDNLTTQEQTDVQPPPVIDPNFM